MVPLENLAKFHINTCVCVCVCVCVRARACALSCVQLFATPWAIAATRLLCPWDFPGKNTGVGYHSLLWRIFLTQGLNPHLLHKTLSCWSYFGQLYGVGWLQVVSELTDFFAQFPCDQFTI